LGLVAGRFSSAEVNPFRLVQRNPDGSVVVTPEMTALHILHRLGASIVACVAGALGTALALAVAGARLLGLALLAGVLIQAAFGIAAVTMSLPLAVVLGAIGTFASTTSG
jgi:heme a synthase